jgi:CheY-like chemotaxis protein
MLSEILNAMMQAELLLDSKIKSIGPRFRRDNPIVPFRILHVDDEPDMLEVVDLALGRDPNLVVKSCSSGTEALAVAADWDPDLILLDLVMPEMGGVATLARLRMDVGTNTPVIFMTGLRKAQEPEYGRSLGAAGVISKPFELTTLAHSVREYVQR